MNTTPTPGWVLRRFMFMSRIPLDMDALLHALGKAMELDPSNAESRSRYALYLEWRGKAEAARIEMQRALKIDPDDSFTLGIMAQFAENDGEPDLKLEYLRRAVAADPLYVLNLAELSSELQHRGNLSEAEIYAQRILDIDPDSSAGISRLAAVRIDQGRGEEALELARQLPDQPVRELTGVLQLQYMALAYHVMGDKERLDAVIAGYIEQFGEELPLDIAEVYAWQGDVDPAFEWIQRSLESTPRELQDRVYDHTFDPLHADPRWVQVSVDLESWKNAEEANKSATY